MTDTAALEHDAEGRYRVVGSMTVETLPALWPALERVARSAGSLEISLLGVNRTDSAGVAALVACTRLAREAHGRLDFVGLPESMRVIIDVSDLQGILGIMPAPPA